METLTDVAIRAWIRSGERFEGRTDGDGVVLTRQEKQERKSTAVARIEAVRSVTTVSHLADEHVEGMINGRW